MAPINLGKLVKKALKRKWYIAGYKPGNRFSASLDDNDDVHLEFIFNHADNYILRARAHQEIGFWHYDERSKRGRKELKPLAEHLLERFGGGYMNTPFYTIPEFILPMFDKKVTADDVNARL